ncbi:LYR family protein [Aspergillus bombycis]|uniref:LYR family protein n=1 Tax=Aspergillus bombycis TaxID=109264 RepID=A0A1F8A2J8_9EURO|nr:LYR family protein [Aspergillus bombycis]OGM45927.1 LYR family protein [Aspergillus bombycis]
MPPTFRSSRSGRQFGDGANRTRTGQIDHDVFEGFRFDDGRASYRPSPKPPSWTDRSHSALLRAARAGCIYIRKATKDAEDEEKEVTDVEEQPALQTTERSFVTRKWTTVPRHLENSEVEFLAKRRPGLPSLYGATTAGANGAENGSAPMRRTRFKKVDPNSGNISIYEAWVPEGHKIEGEITDDSQLVPENSEAIVTPEAPAPGTVIEGVGVVNAEGVVVADPASAAVMTPPKRRPPPPKRKAKGFGKGRRKKVMFAPGEGADANAVHGAGTGPVDGTAETGYGKEGADRSRISVDQNGQEEEEEDAEEGEESDDGDESMLDAKTPETPLHQPSAEPTTDPASEPVPEVVPTSTAPATETVVASQPPAPNPPAVASELTAQALPQPPAVSTVSFAPQQPCQPVQPSTDLPSSTTPPAKPTQEVTPAEDVEMTGVNPELPAIDANAASLPQTTPNTQQQTAPEIIEAPTETATGAVPAQLQHIPQVTAPDSFPVVRSEDPTGKPLEAPSIGQTDLAAQASIEDENVKLEPPAGLPQMPPPGQAPQPEQALEPQQTTQPGQTPHPQPTHQLEDTPQSEQTAQPKQAPQPEQIPKPEPTPYPEPALQQLAAQPAEDIVEDNGSSLLDSLEASLGHAPGVEQEGEAPFGDQTEALPDHNAGHPSTETTQQPTPMEVDVDTMDRYTEPSLQSAATQPAAPIEPVADQPPTHAPEIATENSAEQATELPMEQQIQPPAETPIEPSIEPATQEFTQPSVEQLVEPTMEQIEPKAEELAPVQVEEPLGEPQGAQQPEAQPEPIPQQSSAQEKEPAPDSNSEPPAASLPELPQETPIEQIPQPTEQAVAHSSLEAPVKPSMEQVDERPDASRPETTQPLQEVEPVPTQQPVEPQSPRTATPPAPTVTEDAQPRPIENNEASEAHELTAPNFSPISDLNPELEKKEETEAQPKTGEAPAPAAPGPDIVQNPSN